MRVPEPYCRSLTMPPAPSTWPLGQHQSPDHVCLKSSDSSDSHEVSQCWAAADGEDSQLAKLKSLCSQVGAHECKLWTALHSCRLLRNTTRAHAAAVAAVAAGAVSSGANTLFAGSFPLTSSRYPRSASSSFDWLRPVCVYSSSSPLNTMKQGVERICVGGV